MKFTEGLAIEEEIVEAVQQGCSKLRGEITRLTRENRELVEQYALLNDQYNKISDAEVTPFGLTEFMTLRAEIAEMTGDNVPADIWCRLDEFIDEFNQAKVLDNIIECNGTADFFARLYCMCAHIWNYDEQGKSPADSQEYVLAKLDQCVQDLT